MGGGFGRRFWTDFVSDALQVSQKIKKPVKLVWTREEDIAHDFFRPTSIHKLEGSVNGDKAESWNHRVIAPSISGQIAPERFKDGRLDRSAVNGASNLPYAFPNLKVDYVMSNTQVPVGWWRSVYNSQNAFANEGFLDELAYVAGKDPYEKIPFRSATSEIRNPDGSIVFHLENIQVPESWSQVAGDIIAQKYFRQAGIPTHTKKVEENSVPSWLWRSVPDEQALSKLPENKRTTGENDSRQVFDRLAGTWTYWGWKGGYFDEESDAKSFFDEMRFMLCEQMGAPNSPQWFNTGLNWAYGIDGPPQGHFYVNHKSGELSLSETAYEHPQPCLLYTSDAADE